MCAANSCERCLPSLSDSPQEATSRPQSRRLRRMRSDSHPWWCEHSISTKHRLQRARPPCFQLRFEFSCRFYIYFTWGPLCVFIMSFDLATHPWDWYLISLYDVATLTCSLIRVLDNAVLICAGRHWLAAYGCYFNLRHLNIPGVDCCYFIF